VFDFGGTGPQVLGNLNAPPAVTFSAVIYSLRCLLDSDIPLNEGCLAPIRFIIPQGCVLNPEAEAAVVGGNVLTSQRVTDVVLRAFDAAAASQGCMNNVTFGDSGFGYYETVAGGCGAGPGFHGRSGTHSHMTNTRISDPEILELRFPVTLRAFRLRPGSGGAGRWRGGCGVLRELELLRPLNVGILSESRSLPPFGLSGGRDAARGVNLWLQAKANDSIAFGGWADGESEEEAGLPGGAEGPFRRIVSLGGKAAVMMQAGERLRLLTPGGGGYGDVGEAGEAQEAPPGLPLMREGGSLDAYRATAESA
jgi:5-oxoprolinase (ATP-hydrolysing)